MPAKRKPKPRVVRLELWGSTTLWGVAVLDSDGEWQGFCQPGFGAVDAKWFFAHSRHDAEAELRRCPIDNLRLIEIRECAPKRRSKAKQ